MVQSISARKRMVRGAAAVAAAGLMLGLAACGGDSGNSGGGGSDGGDGEITGSITFQTWSLTPTFQDYLDGVIAAFEEANPGTEVTLQDQPGDGYSEKVLTQAASNTLPDVINLPPDFALPLAKAGMLDNLDESDPNLTETYVAGGLEAYQFPGLEGTWSYPWYLNTDINYTPSQGWFHSWLDLDHAAVARDFAQIASLGLDHVRIFPLWPIVQPNRSLLRPRALREIREVVDLAGEAGLDVGVDAIQGHLSSFDFLPSWLATWHDRNMFTNPDVVGSLADYVREVAAAVADASNLLGVTVGNEVNQFAARPHPDPHEATPAQVTQWLDAMIGAARDGLGDVEPPAGVTHAMYDASWYDDRQPFLPEHAAELGDLTVTHSWVFNGSAQRHGGLGTGSVRHAEYLLRLSAAWHRDPARPLWLQEVGAPTNVVAVKDAPEFLERTVRNAATVPGLWGITWWCSHDVARSLADFPPLEYDLGLFTNDGETKPTGRRLAELAERRHELVPVTKPGPGIVVDDSDPTTYRAQLGPGGSVFEAWNATAEEEGVGPHIVLRSRIGESVDLAPRGIVELRAVAVAAPEPIDVLHPAVTTV